MVEEEHEPPTRAQDTGHLADGVVDGVDVFKNQARHRRVERSIDEGQLGGASPGIGDTAPSAPGLSDLRLGGVDARNCHPRCRQATRQLPLAGTHVQHARPAGQPLVGERENLLGIFRVDSLSELPLPPVGVALPEIGVEIVGRRHDGDTTDDRRGDPTVVLRFSPCRTPP